jgi:hypothetical protein
MIRGHYPDSSLSCSFQLAHRYRGPAFELKVVGPSMLGIGCPGRHALPLTHPPTIAENAPTATRVILRKRVRCGPGMLNSSEVKVLYPTRWR